MGQTQDNFNMFKICYKLLLGDFDAFEEAMDSDVT